MFMHFPFVFRPKRPSSEEMGSGASTKKPISPQPRRDARQIYNPPSGKYSASIGNFNYGEYCWWRLSPPLFSFVYFSVV